MQLTETLSEGLKRSFRVVIPASDLQQRLNAKIEEVRPQVRLNGFRPGKVPASHVRKLYGASMLKEIIDGEVEAAARQATQDGAMRTAAAPAIRLESNMDRVVAGEEDLAFGLEVELIPEFEPMDVSTIVIERLTTPVEDTEVDERLQQLADGNQTFEPKDGAADEGDSLLVTFVGKVDGEAFEGGAAENATVVIGAGRLIPGFEEQLKGAVNGEERTLNVTFPAEYAREDLAGKDATFDVTVHEVNAPKKRDLDDAFAGELGFPTLDELKAAIRKNLESEVAAQSRNRAKRALFDQLDQSHDFPLPPNMVEQEFAQIWTEVQRAKETGDIDPADAEKTEAELQDEYRGIAARRVKLGLVLAEIGRRNNIQVTNDELSAAIIRQARQFPGQERQFMELVRERADIVAQLRAPIYEDKTVDFILELAKVENKTVDRETLFAEPEG